MADPVTNAHTFNYFTYHFSALAGPATYATLKPVLEGFTREEQVSKPVGYAMWLA